MREWTQKHIEEICIRLIKKYLSGSAEIVETDENNNDKSEGGTTNETE